MIKHAVLLLPEALNVPFHVNHAGNMFTGREAFVQRLEQPGVAVAVDRQVPHFRLRDAGFLKHPEEQEPRGIRL